MKLLSTILVALMLCQDMSMATYFHIGFQLISILFQYNSVFGLNEENWAQTPKFEKF